MDVQHGRDLLTVTGRQPFPRVALASSEGCYGPLHIFPEMTTNVHRIREKDMAFARCCSHFYGE